MAAFKIGDHVRVKDGIKLEPRGETLNWGGEVLEVYSGHRTCLVGLDAITLRSLDDQYLLDCIEDGSDPWDYVFEFDDLILSRQRDTDEEWFAAEQEVHDRMVDLGAEFEDDDVTKEDILEELMESWTEEFSDSVHFEALDDYRRESAGFVINTFMSMMYNYGGVMPEAWNAALLEEICLDVVPRKVSDEPEFFEAYGDVLIRFLQFLADENYISNTPELIGKAREIKDEIPKIAADPSNWGMAKSFFMGAKSEGVDIADSASVDEFIAAYNLKLASETGDEDRNQPPKDPFHGIGRNDKISVRYADGTVKEQVKFKHVERDLRNGKCELLRN